MARLAKINVNVEDAYRLAMALRHREMTSYQVHDAIEEMASERVARPFAQFPWPGPPCGSRLTWLLWVELWTTCRSPTWETRPHLVLGEFKPKHIRAVRDHLRSLIVMHRARPALWLGKDWLPYLEKGLRLLPEPPEEERRDGHFF